MSMREWGGVSVVVARATPKVEAFAERLAAAVRQQKQTQQGAAGLAPSSSCWLGGHN